MSTSMADANGEIQEKFTLYAEQVWNGAMRNEIGVLSAKGGNELGLMVFVDLPLHDELGGQTAPVVGRMQGVSSKVSWAGQLFHRSFCMVLTDPKYQKDPNNVKEKEISTLAVLGAWEKLSPAGSAAAIVGGTGKYTLARGVVELKPRNTIGDTQYIELKFHVLYRPMPDSHAR